MHEEYGGLESDFVFVNLWKGEIGRPLSYSSVNELVRRTRELVGFHFTVHQFRHTFATVEAKLGWNFEHLRAAMGHSDYGMLQRYVRLATERDLGPRSDWLDLIANNPATEWA
jgi:integrase